MDLGELRGFLKTFPEGSHAKEAKFDLSLHQRIEDIRSGKVKDAFVIPFDEIKPRWQSWQQRKPERDAVGVYRDGSSAGMFRSLGSGKIATDDTGMIITPTGHGSILAVETSGLPCSYISENIVFQSEKEETLYFGVVEGKS